jgi:hypothetical protein
VAARDGVSLVMNGHVYRAVAKKDNNNIATWACTAKKKNNNNIATWAYAAKKDNSNIATWACAAKKEFGCEAVLETDAVTRGVRFVNGGHNHRTDEKWFNVMLMQSKASREAGTKRQVVARAMDGLNGSVARGLLSLRNRFWKKDEYNRRRIVY